MAVVFRALGGLTINKLFAVYFGTNGITLLSHFQNLTSLFTLLPSEGINRAVIKHWSDPKASEESKFKIWQTGFWLTNVVFLAVFAVLYFWKRDFFFTRFVDQYSVEGFLSIFLPSVFLMLITALLNAVILAYRDVKGYAMVSIGGMILLVGTVVFTVKQGELNQALLSFVVGYALMFFCAVIYFVINRKKVRLQFKAPDGDSLKKIGHFILMALSAIALGKLLDFVVREYIIETYGADRTGLWQSVAKMSSSYLLVFTGTVGVVYYPKMASLIHNDEALRKYVGKVMGFVAFVTLLCLGIYYLNRSFLLQLFFDKGFEKAAYLVRYQAIGDFFCILSYLLAYLLSARVKTFKYMFAQVFSAGIYVGMIYLLIGRYNLESLTLAYMWRFVGFFLILVLFNRKLLFPKISQIEESVMSKVR
jgi:O-antigen/teichoic acid export membrane protein